MDRKALVTILIIAGLMAGWHFGYYAPRARENQKRYEEFKKQQAADEKAKRAASGDVATGTASAQPGPANATGTQPAPVATPNPVPPADPAEPEERKIVSSEVGTVDYVFTNHSGGIARVVLKEHEEDKSKGTKVVLNEFGTIPIGAFSLNPDEETPIKAAWAMSVDEESRVVTFSRTVPGNVDGVPLGQIKITKRFSLPRKPDENDRRRVKLRSEYLVGLDVTCENTGSTPTRVPKFFMHVGSAAPINRHETAMYQGVDYWRDGDTHFKDTTWFSAGGFLMWSHPERPVLREDGDLMRWVAVTNQYFTTMLTITGAEDKPQEEQRPLLGVTVWAKRRAISADDWRKPNEWRPIGHEINGNAALFNVDAAIALPEFAIPPGQSVTRTFHIYAGPREYRRLRLLDHNESDVLNYGSFLGIPTGPFSRLLLNTMNWIYSWTGSYFLAIILLTIAVKAILWPLQNKANRSMKKMSALQPEMKRLQEKYKEEPVKFQQEMGKVWKKAGVNPLSGCWPIFIQVPIFIGFYNMLGKAVELRHHGFAWVKDLSQPDTIGHFLGLAYLPINPLPLLMAGTMFLQMMLTPQTGDAAQRRMFMFMPLIFIFMCYNFASALALYWTVQNLISIVQLKMNRDKSAKEAPAVSNP